MDHFSYKDGELHAESVPVRELAEQYGTPFYCYSTATLTRHYQVFADALAGLDFEIHYAVKANSNIGVIATLAQLGAGADIVSIGELDRTNAAGIAPSKVVFSGVGKTVDEIERALRGGIHQINVESLNELEVISEVATRLGVTAQVAIRVNPNVDAKTHVKITTGKSENKFGIAWEQAHDVFDRARALPGLDVAGVAVHIGSQLTDLAPYRAAYEKVRGLVEDLRTKGFDIRELDLGGGLGIPYGSENPPTPEAYGAMVKEVMAGFDCKLAFEPGRMIVGNAGILVSRTIYVKHGVDRAFLILDAAMNDLIRPALYDAYHEIIPVKEPISDATTPMDIVGPVCESGDTFAKERAMPPLEDGDLVAFRSAGAYAAVMASTYNSRDIIPEILVNDTSYSLVADRITVKDMLKREFLPDWLTQPTPKEAAG